VSGGLAGLTAGYDWESNHMVAGVASDFSWASIGGSTSGTPADLCGGSPSICSSELQWLGTVRGRFGYATDNVLSYLTGGAAFGSLYGREGTGPSDGFYGDGSAWRLGWTVGAGVEARINQHWTAGIEYLYVDLVDGHVFDDTAGTSTFAQFLDFKSNIVRVSLNYQFGTP
jgi:outer membrane immunogenic protein